ncbi:hypothetical protein [Ensifer adhaerens]|uniref:hypothetical protein n=1 Tax=Ensifer adhaerens TaxID=106592 RepID=UPI0031590BBE
MVVFKPRRSSSWNACHWPTQSIERALDGILVPERLIRRERFGDLRGRFDPTVQPLWLLWVESAANGTRPGSVEVDRVLTNVG